MQRLVVTAFLPAGSQGALPSCSCGPVAALALALEERRWSSVLTGCSHATHFASGCATSTRSLAGGRARPSGSPPTPSPAGRGSSRAQLPAGKAAAGAAPDPADDSHLIRVILRQDVVGLGLRGDIVLAKRGDVRHKLYPSARAAYATPENVSKYSLSGDDRKPLLAAEQERKAEVEKLVKALARKPVVVSRQPSPDNPEAFLRGGRVDTAAILAAVRRQLGIGLDASHVLADAPIDTFGSYKVPLNLRTLEGQQVELTVHVDRRAVREATSAAAAAGARQAAA